MKINVGRGARRAAHQLSAKPAISSHAGGVGADDALPAACQISTKSLLYSVTRL